MSTTEPVMAAVLAPERRLHPMSWLFVLIQQLRQFVVPIAALVVFGRGDRNELWPLIGAAVLVVIAIWRYFTYRYAIEDDRLLVRSGLFERSARVIPFARIQNVSLQQTVLHRMFDVAEVKLESAGGSKPEAEMRVLRLGEAMALETLIRAHGQAPAPPSVSAGSMPPTELVQPLLRLGTGDVLRLGLISNRGLVVAAAGTAGLMQFEPENAGPGFIEKLGRRAMQEITGYGGAHGFGPADYALAAVAVFAGLLVALRLLSIALALAQFHGFELGRQGRRLVMVRGLGARWRSSLSLGRIQVWTVREGVLHRLFGRRNLSVQIAAATGASAPQRNLHDLAPVATPAVCDGLIAGLLPASGWPALPWQPIPHAGWWRLALPGTFAALLASAVLTVRMGLPGLLPLLWLPVGGWLAWRRIRCMAYAITPSVVAVRDGWWSRSWRIAEVDKLQVLELSRSPLDRRLGTAALLLDTAGGGTNEAPLHLRLLPVEVLRALHGQLAARLARMR